MDVLAAASARVDAATPGNRGRIDLGEMAQGALAETLAAAAGPHLDTLFGTGPGDVQRAFGQYAIARRFGGLAHAYFARLLAKFFLYHLSMTLPLHVGPGRRFDSLAAKERLDRELAHHGRERTLILDTFAGGWWSKERWEGGAGASPRPGCGTSCTGPSAS